MAFKPNPGRLPDDCIELDDEGNETGKVFRVHVRCFGGYCTKDGKEPNGWPAGGRGACNWRISKPPFAYEIKEYEVIYG